MADLTTMYMGMNLANPILVGASGLTSNLDTIRELERAGAGAIVLKSLFEEQIQLEQFLLDENLEKYNYRHAEMITVAPPVVHQGPREHLMWVREVKQAVRIPVFASLNAVQPKTWIEYARQLADTGVDGLECNFFASPADPHASGFVMENEQVDLAAQLKQAVSIPVSIKLSPFYTNVLNVVHRMDQAGIDGFVLFNRLFEPDIDPASGSILSPFHFSRETDSRLPLRYAGLLEGRIRAGLCCSTGIMDGDQVVKLILAGADAVQVVSALYERGLSHLRTMLDDLRTWMDQKGYETLTEFQGALSQRHVADPHAYTRTQYVKLLMNPEAILHNAPVL